MVPPVTRAPPSSSRYDDVHPHVPVFRDSTLLTSLVISGRLKCATYSVETRLVLVHLRFCFWTNACMPRPRVHGIAQEAPHRNVFFSHRDAPPNAHESCCRKMFETNILTALQGMRRLLALVDSCSIIVSFQPVCCSMWTGPAVCSWSKKCTCVT